MSIHGLGMVLLAMPFAFVAAVGAQTAAEPALKAAFLYNFAKFTEWPPDALKPTAPLVFCSTDAAIAGALTEMTTGRAVGGHPIEIRGPALDDPLLPACHVLYVANLDTTRAARLLGRLRGAAVLTVGDSDGFVPLGGVAQFFVEDGRMRFRVGTASITRARLRLGAQLLNLARIVEDSP